jgi:hypothetical protein
VQHDSHRPQNGLVLPVEAQASQHPQSIEPLGEPSQATTLFVSTRSTTGVVRTLSWLRI